MVARLMLDDWIRGTITGCVALPALIPGTGVLTFAGRHHLQMTSVTARQPEAPSTMHKRGSRPRPASGHRRWHTRDKARPGPSKHPATSAGLREHSSSRRSVRTETCKHPPRPQARPGWRCCMSANAGLWELTCPRPTARDSQCLLAEDRSRLPSVIAGRRTGRRSAGNIFTDTGRQPGAELVSRVVLGHFRSMDTLGLFPRMKDQQLEQDDGEQRGGDPGSADACPPDHVVDGGRVCQGLVLGCGCARGGRLVPPAGCDVMDRTSHQARSLLPSAAC